MTRKIIFFALALLIFSSAWLVSEQKKASTNIVKSALYPDLMEEINLVSKITIKNNEKEITIRRKNQKWMISENDGFLAQTSLIRKILLQIANLETLEKKSTTESGHRVIGENRLDEEGIPRRQITFFTIDDRVLVDLIVGKKITDTNSERYFARRNDRAQSWIVEGAIDFSPQPITWVNSKIMDVGPEMIKSIIIKRKEAPAIIVSKSNKSDTLFTLQDIPEGNKPKSTTMISSFGSLLADLRFDDVLSAERVANTTSSKSTTVQLFENAEITLLDFPLNGKIYTRIEFLKHENSTLVPNSDSAKYTLSKESEKWIYLLPRYKRRIIERKFSSLFTKVD